MAIENGTKIVPHYCGPQHIFNVVLLGRVITFISIESFDGTKSMKNLISWTPMGLRNNKECNELEHPEAVDKHHEGFSIKKD